ncbi:MAG: Stf0 family sulfotransferase [Pseudomonadota bacterium]
MTEAYPKPAVIFCATQRSGSTMIVDDFQNVTERKRSQSEALYHKVLAAEDGPKDWPGAIALLEDLRADDVVFFDKVMFHYLPRLSQMIDPNSAAPECAAFASFFRNAVWVHIRRANIFEQAVSKFMAEATDVWDKRAVQDENYNAGLMFDGEKAKRMVRNFVREDEQWRRFFRLNEIKPIEVYYEDAVGNFPTYLTPVFGALGLEADLEKPRDRRMQKLGNERNVQLSGILRDLMISDLIRTSDRNAKKG